MTRTPVRLPDADTMYDTLLRLAHTHRAMSPLHPKWSAFLDALWVLLGSTFDGMTGRCPSRTAPEPYPMTKLLLTSYQCEPTSSIVILSALGGHCDCTILFNAQEATPDTFPDTLRWVCDLWVNPPSSA